jgi:hypothetical protein
VIRLVGFVLMGFGVALIFRPLAVIAEVGSLFGSLVGAGVGFFAFSLAAALSLVTIVLAWIAYRPVFGGIILALASALGTLTLLKLKKGDASRKTVA